MATRVFADEELARLREFPDIGRDELIRSYGKRAQTRAEHRWLSLWIGRTLDVRMSSKVEPWKRSFAVGIDVWNCVQRQKSAS